MAGTGDGDLGTTRGVGGENVGGSRGPGGRGRAGGRARGARRGAGAPRTWEVVEVLGVAAQKKLALEP